MTLDRDNLNTHIKRIKDHLPPAGSVQILKITERQYESRTLLISKQKPDLSTKTERAAQLSLFF